MIMYNRLTKLTGVFLCVISMISIACEDDIDPVIQELNTSRVFAPVGLEARVRNQVNIELSWTADPSVDQYIIEFFQDSLVFSGENAKLEALHRKWGSAGMFHRRDGGLIVPSSNVFLRVGR